MHHPLLEINPLTISFALASQALIQGDNNIYNNLSSGPEIQTDHVRSKVMAIVSSALGIGLPNFDHQDPHPSEGRQVTGYYNTTRAVDPAPRVGPHHLGLLPADENDENAGRMWAGGDFWGQQGQTLLEAGNPKHESGLGAVQSNRHSQLQVSKDTGHSDHGISGTAVQRRSQVPDPGASHRKLEAGCASSDPFLALTPSFSTFMDYDNVALEPVEKSSQLQPGYFSDLMDPELPGEPNLGSLLMGRASLHPAVFSSLEDEPHHFKPNQDMIPEPLATSGALHSCLRDQEPDELIQFLGSASEEFSRYERGLAGESRANNVTGLFEEMESDVG